ncbi:MAG: hypothetical protein VST68_08955, partial [Nitrospirota bacterium]|nr:hypothetical protein [Nitrospirota bacterium]
YFMPYLFHWRHGLPLILLIVIAFGYFSIQHDPWLRHGAALFMVLSLSANAGGVIGAFMKEGSFQGPIKSEREFVQWLSQQEPKPLLVTTRPQALGAHTEGRFHWVRCKESREQMLAYLRVVQVDHLITMENEEKCSFYLSIAEYLMPIQEFNDEQRKITVWRVLERGLQDGIASDISRNIKKNRKDLSIEGDYKVQKGRA